MCCSNTHVTCAERRVVAACVADAVRHGVPSHRQVHWIRRKYGGALSVYRERHDGSPGCSVPCVLCRRELLRFRVPVLCFASDGTWFRGHLDHPDAPESKPTAGQKANARANSRRK